MTDVRDRISERNDIDGEGRADRRSHQRSVLPTSSLGAIRGPLSLFGMALGYLGLVAILSMAPFWHLALSPQQSQPMVCTDFGGSR